MTLFYYRTDKETGNGERVTLVTIRKKIADNYCSINKAINNLKNGKILHTIYANYHAEEQPGPADEESGPADEEPRFSY